MSPKQQRLFDDWEDDLSEVEERAACSLCTTPSRGPKPPHRASERCESGKRSHCTCDTCF